MDDYDVALVNTLLSRSAASGGKVHTNELRRCFLDLDKKCMVIDFNIASKGGGKTNINIKCSIEDIVNVLNKYMDVRPGEVSFDARLVPPKRHKVRWNPFKGEEYLVQE